MDLQLKEYIENNILPEYEKNDKAHGIDHIKYVIDRSKRFAKEVENINEDMVYIIAVYHDIGHHIDAKQHEKVSAQILNNDKEIKKYFTEKEIRIMVEAVEDHRASLKGEPRNTYGKIVSTADRMDSIDDCMKRTYGYTLKHNPQFTIEEIIEESRNHLIKKFCKGGYAEKKVYFKDEQYIKFVEEITEVSNNIEEFEKRYRKVNGLENIN